MSTGGDAQIRQAKIPNIAFLRSPSSSPSILPSGPEFPEKGYLTLLERHDRN